MNEWYDEESEGYERLFQQIGPEWANEHAQQLFEENARLFTAQRLKSYYVQHPEVARPAVSTVEYAKTLMPGFPAAAFVFAATSVELTWKTAILKPLVSGVVHVETLAEEIVDRAVPKTGGLAQLEKFLSAILKEISTIDLTTYKRSNTKELLRLEINKIAQARNVVLHTGHGVDSATAKHAIEVAESMLLELFPKLIDSLGLKLDGTCTVHDTGIPSY